MKGLLRRAIRALDRWLTRRMEPLELWEDEDSLLHGCVIELDRPLDLGERSLPAGTTVLELHLLNEDVPEIPASGPDLGWAAHSSRRFLQTLRATARRLQADPRFASVEAVGGTTVLLSNDSKDRNLLARLGFTVRPYRGSLGSFGTFWENVYSWMLMWAYNPETLRQRSFRSLRRFEAWISREAFVARFAPAETDP